MSVMGLWAKENPSSEGGYHPLVYHLIDVSMVAEALWVDVISDNVKTDVAKALGLSIEDAGQWVSFLAGCHDVGKASIAFALRLDAAQQRLAELGFKSPREPSSSAPHGDVTAAELPNILTEKLGLAQRVAQDLSVAIGGHHGRFAERATLRELPSQAVGLGPWANAREELVLALASIHHLPSPPTQSPVAKPGLMWLAGLVSVADWIGSNTDFFHFACPDPRIALDFDPDYVDRSRQIARQALAKLGWRVQTKSSSMPFEEMFGFVPNAMQKAVMALEDRLDQPGLVVVEAPMGEGKTEAAFWLADAWSQRLGTSGVYVALPTQATSNQMFTRFEDFLKKRYPAQVAHLQLLHGHAALSAAFQEIKTGNVGEFEPTGVNADRQPGGDGSVVAGEWFTNRKRGLLAPFGVGTIDQILLAALQVNHVFVRLFGLAGKPVIVDEVHAYDVYMSTLLERLLGWLGALHSPVVLLSATLPESRRKALCAAYLRGLGKEGPDLGPAGYPRVTWVSASGDADCRSVSPGSARDTSTPHHASKRTGGVTLRYLNDVDPLPPGEDLVARLEEALRDGGCAAVICNTVRRAQETYQRLKPHFSGAADDGLAELDLLHARYPYCQRMERELRTLKRFGKPGATVKGPDGRKQEVVRPNRAILVATQIVEQSLDIDFDLMVTDIAPIDLMLQRMGRLWRHHGRRRPLDKPEVWVRGVGGPNGSLPRLEAGSCHVYYSYILWRTWLELQARGSRIDLDADIQPLVEAIYGEDWSSWRELGAKAGEALEGARREMEAELDDDQAEAKSRYLGAPTSSLDLARLMSRPRAEDQPDLHPKQQALTRLTEPSVTVVLLHGPEDAPSRLDGTRIDTGRRPTALQAEELLRWSVNLSSRLVVGPLLGARVPESRVPDGWQKSALMRTCRPLYLIDDYETLVGSATIRLDSELGVVIEKQGSADG